MATTTVQPAPATHIVEKQGEPRINAVGKPASDTSVHHFGDWPNSVGFNASQEQRDPTELKVTGKIPAYASGVLYRTGPGHARAAGPKGDFDLSHWFDGFTHVHRFQISSGPNDTSKVVYNSRGQLDKLLDHVRKTGKLQGVSFGQKRDPCESLFKKLKTTFEPLESDDTFMNNVGVTVNLNVPGVLPNAGGKDILIAATDNSRFKSIDPETLEPQGCTKQTSLHPSLKGPLAAAHSAKDPITGDVFNYNLNLGATETYKVFKTSASTGETEILASISGPKIRGAYIHSMFLTEDFVILCVWPAYLAAKGSKILWERNIMDALAPFNNSAESRWLVVDRRHGRGLVATFTSPAMFSFHTVNAWQTPASDGNVDILCELVEYPNMDILHRLYYDNLRSTGPGVKDFVGPTSQYKIAERLARYRLTGVPATTGSKKDVAVAQEVFKLPSQCSGDLPIINPRFTTKPHRYVYSVSGSGKSSFVETIRKTDTETQTSTHWEHPKNTPGEPIFVANPQGQAEDDGVLLSVILDGEKGTSYLLCLDAKTMTELARADCGIPVGFGFHGSHYTST